MFRRVRFRWSFRRTAHFLRSRPGRCVTVAIACLLVLWLVFRLLFVTSNTLSNSGTNDAEVLASYTNQRFHEIRHDGPTPLCRAPTYTVYNATEATVRLPECETTEPDDPPIYYEPVLELAARRLQLNHSHPLAWNVSSCRVRAIEWRSDNRADHTSEAVFKASELGVVILHDFILTECVVKVGHEQRKVHQVLVQASQKPEVHDRITKQLKVMGRHRRPDVLIVVIGDADVQRRQQLLPKTSAYLETRQTVDLPGLNGLSYDIRDNVIPLLTGRHLDELPNARRGTTSSQFVDAFNFLWYEYEKHAYATLFAEDTVSRAVFNEKLHGFENRPADHYMRPFWMEMPRTSCIYGRHRQDYFFDFVRDFFFNYNNVTKFAVMIHHPGIEGNSQSISALDDSLANLLTSLSVEEGIDSNLALFLFGVPHLPTRGVNDPFELSEITRRLAFAQVMLPNWFKVQYNKLWNNFIQNTGQITTFFDMNMFLRDLLKVDAATPTLGPNKDIHAHRLVRDMIRDKNCISAGVPMFWCTCVRKDRLNATDPVANQAVKHLLQHMNQRTEEDRVSCMRLSKYQLLYVDIFTMKTKETVRYRGGPVHIRDDERISMHYFHLVIRIEGTDSEFAGVVGLDVQTGTYTTFIESIVRLTGRGDSDVKNERIRALCVSKSY